VSRSLLQDSSKRRQRIFDFFCADEAVDNLISIFVNKVIIKISQSSAATQTVLNAKFC